MSYSLRELRQAPTDELIQRHDREAENVSAGVNYYLSELARRDAHEQGERMLRLTRYIALLTVAVTVLTATNVVAVFFLGD